MIYLLKEKQKETKEKIKKQAICLQYWIMSAEKTTCRGIADELAIKLQTQQIELPSNNNSMLGLTARRVRQIATEEPIRSIIISSLVNIKFDSPESNIFLRNQKTHTNLLDFDIWSASNLCMEMQKGN